MLAALRPAQRRGAELQGGTPGGVRCDAGARGRCSRRVGAKTNGRPVNTMASSPTAVTANEARITGSRPNLRRQAGPEEALLGVSLLVVQVPQGH